MRRTDLPLIRHKDDIATVEALIRIGYPGIKPVLPYMFIWLQDLNWPVAEPLLGFLSTIGEAAVPEIRRVLRTDDDIWKRSCLVLLQRMPPEAGDLLMPELESIANQPTPGESAEEVDVAAPHLILELRKRKST